jgi:hypothetical protein
MVGNCCLSIVLVLGAVAPAMAQRAGKNPYGDLFKPPDLKAAVRAAQLSAPPAEPPCGTTRVPVDRQRDPKMATDQSLTHYSMRVIKPGCK